MLRNSYQTLTPEDKKIIRKAFDVVSMRTKTNAENLAKY
jgi:TRAP-type C4-dicarboxylate transport system substrate-binding protein